MFHARGVPNTQLPSAPILSRLTNYGPQGSSGATKKNASPLPVFVCNIFKRFVLLGPLARKIQWPIDKTLPGANVNRDRSRVPPAQTWEPLDSSAGSAPHPWECVQSSSGCSPCALLRDPKTTTKMSWGPCFLPLCSGILGAASFVLT